MTGAELATIRKRAGFTLLQLARRCGISRDAVSYWERKAVFPRRGWALSRMAEVLGVRVFPAQYARAGMG